VICWVCTGVCDSVHEGERVGVCVCVHEGERVGVRVGVWLGVGIGVVSGSPPTTCAHRQSTSCWDYNGDLVGITTHTPPFTKVDPASCAGFLAYICSKDQVRPHRMVTLHGRREWD
jgi:hypothetical protein